MEGWAELCHTRNQDEMTIFLNKRWKELPLIIYVIDQTLPCWTYSPSRAYASFSPCLDPNSFEPKLILNPNFFNPNFFGPIILLNQKRFWTQNLFGNKICLDTKLFWTQNCFGHEICLVENFLRTKHFFQTKIFLWTLWLNFVKYIRLGIYKIFRLNY